MYDLGLEIKRGLLNVGWVGRLDGNTLEKRIGNINFGNNYTSMVSAIKQD